MALSIDAAPGMAVTKPPPASVRSCVLHAFRRTRPEADHAVLRLEEDVHVLWQMVGDEARQADAEVDQHLRLDFLRDALSDDVLVVHQMALSRRWVTSTPGVLTASGRDDADRHDVVWLGDHDFGRERHDRIEIVRGQRVFEVAVVVGLLAADEGEVALDRLFQQVGLAVDLDGLLALFNQGADAGRSEDAAETDAAGANALDERALRRELDLDFARDHLLLRLGVEADVGGDELCNRAGRDELADAVAGGSRVVRDDGQVLDAAHDYRVDEPMGRADAHEAADQADAPLGMRAAASSADSAVFISAHLPAPSSSAQKSH